MSRPPALNADEVIRKLRRAGSQVNHIIGGEALHGLLFDVLRGHDATFAASLHQEVEKPFSLSSVLTEHPKRDGRLHIGADGRIEFRARSMPRLDRPSML